MMMSSSGARHAASARRRPPTRGKAWSNAASRRHPASVAAVSIDELAIVIARESLHRIDPALGWHLWATDLCLTAITRHGVLPRLVRLPLFHNSSNDYVLPEAFHRSAATLAAKHAGFGVIHNLWACRRSAALTQRRLLIDASPLLRSLGDRTAQPRVAASERLGWQRGCAIGAVHHTRQGRAQSACQKVANSSRIDRVVRPFCRREVALHTGSSA